MYVGFFMMQNQCQERKRDKQSWKCFRESDPGRESKIGFSVAIVTSIYQSQLFGNTAGPIMMCKMNDG